jgi:hypothetical protein
MKINYKKARKPFIFIVPDLYEGDFLNTGKCIKRTIVKIIESVHHPISLDVLRNSILFSAGIIVFRFEPYLEDEDIKSICQYRKRSKIIVPLAPGRQLSPNLSI